MRSRATCLLLGILCLPLLTIALPTQAAPSAKMWDVVHARDWDLVVRSIERQSGIFPASSNVESPSDRIAVLVIDLTNRTSIARQFDASDFSLATSNGVRFVNLTAATAGQDYTVGRGLSPLETAVEPGATMTTGLLFAIPFDSGRFTLRFAPARTAIEIDECHCNLPSPVRAIERVDG
jgi:hypothetical protein